MTSVNKTRLRLFILVLKLPITGREVRRLKIKIFIQLARNILCVFVFNLKNKNNIANPYKLLQVYTMAWCTFCTIYK